VWRNIQLLFIDTYILIHRFIDDDDDDDDDNDIVATKKDYIKDTNSYINICPYMYIYIERRNTPSEPVVECCVIITIRTLYIVQY
jgi:hypothetical protein